MNRFHILLHCLLLEKSFFPFSQDNSSVSPAMAELLVTARYFAENQQQFTTTSASIRKTDNLGYQALVWEVVHSASGRSLGGHTSLVSKAVPSARPVKNAAAKQRKLDAAALETMVSFTTDDEWKGHLAPTTWPDADRFKVLQNRVLLFIKVNTPLFRALWRLRQMCASSTGTIPTCHKATRGFHFSVDWMVDQLPLAIQDAVIEENEASDGE